MISRAVAIAGALAVGVGLWLSPTPALAELELCNRTSYIIYAAIAVAERDSVTTQGWTRVVPGDCKTAIDRPLSKANYFVYARTSTAHGGPPRDWGGGVRLCAAQGNFRLRNSFGTVTCNADASALPFAKIDTRGLDVWTMTFTESKDLNTVDAARTAGLKRLLHDNGARIDHLDGKPDKQTGSALSNFRKRTKLAANSGTRGMFDALETEALKTTAPTGYSICNDSDGDVWAVIGVKGGRDWLTRGWWKITKGSCVKAITTALSMDKVFLHAEKHGNAKLVSGKDTFCLTNMQFELEGRTNCAKRGLTEAGFAMTVTKGVAGYAAHIDNQGLVMPLRPGPRKPK